MGKKFAGVGDFTIHGNDIDIDGVTSFDGGEFNRVTHRHILYRRAHSSSATQQ